MSILRRVSMSTPKSVIHFYADAETVDRIACGESIEAGLTMGSPTDLLIANCYKAMAKHGIKPLEVPHALAEK